MYPGGADKTDYAEVLAELAYAPKQQALGKCYSPLDNPTEPFGCGATGAM